MIFFIVEDSSKRTKNASKNLIQAASKNDEIEALQGEIEEWRDLHEENRKRQDKRTAYVDELQSLNFELRKSLKISDDLQSCICCYRK